MKKIEKAEFLNEKYVGRLFRWNDKVALLLKFEVESETLILVEFLIDEKVQIKEWRFGTELLIRWLDDKQNNLQEEENPTKENGSENS